MCRLAEICLSSESGSSSISQRVPPENSPINTATKPASLLPVMRRTHSMARNNTRAKEKPRTMSSEFQACSPPTRISWAANSSAP